MKSYRVKNVSKAGITLEFEVYIFEDRLEGREKDLMVPYRKGLFEDQWVAVDDEGVIGS